MKDLPVDSYIFYPQKCLHYCLKFLTLTFTTNMSPKNEEEHLEDISKDSVEQIEDAEPEDYVKVQSDLSGIEATAASKTAWLISIVVSIGGLLFGMLSM